MEVRISTDEFEGHTVQFITGINQVQVKALRAAKVTRRECESRGHPEDKDKPRVTIVFLGLAEDVDPVRRQRRKGEGSTRRPK